MKTRHWQEIKETQILYIFDYYWDFVRNIIELKI